MIVTLCYTSEDGGYDWLEKQYHIDEINYKDVIDEYVKENQPKADHLSLKWELDGNPDPLYLNYRMSRTAPHLFRLIDNYMEDNY